MHRITFKNSVIAFTAVYSIAVSSPTQANDLAISTVNPHHLVEPAIKPDTGKTSDTPSTTDTASPADTPKSAKATTDSFIEYDLPKPLTAIDPLPQALKMKDGDIWIRIRKGFGMPNLDNPLVVNQLNWYVKRPDYIQRTTTRASLYLYHVVEELEKRNMPTELALLPFIESAFNPQAYSSAKAAGMWQFIPSTGRSYDLKQSAFKDERRDVLASTDAALTYLQKLYGMFGDWQLALAAYNWGEGSVQRAINRNRAAGKPIDFNSLSPLMPPETRNYVPKLQAVKDIISTPGYYSITLPKVDNEPYFVTIGKTRDMDIKIAAQLAEISIDEFKALNPQFNRPVITGDKDTQILLPQTNAEKFKTNLSNWTQALSSWTVHKVTSAREKIDVIAKKFGTTPAVIREANNIPPRTHLIAGSTILVPKPANFSSEKDISPDVSDHATVTMESEYPTKRVHVKVRKSDSLASIAKRNGVSVAQIKSWNNLKTDQVAVGKRLQLFVISRTVQGGKNTKRGVRKQNPSRAKATKGKKVPVKAAASKPKMTSNRVPVKNQGATVTLASSK